MRVGFVAREVARHGGIAICALVSPYRATRDQVRATIGADRFVEVFMDTPLDVCERRDVKGLYQRARAGELTGLTGIDDPYEPPLAGALVLETAHRSPGENAMVVLAQLIARGLVATDVQMVSTTLPTLAR